jgi:hypothetical protein
MPRSRMPRKGQAAVRLVVGDEGGPDALVVRVLQQITGELRFRLEHDIVRNSGQFAALLVGGPGLGHVQAQPARGFPPGEAGRDLPDQSIEQALMHVMVYRGTRGCVWFLFHKAA